MNFGERLKQLRQGRNWSQPELAEAIGIEQSYLSKLENDKSLPSPDVLNRIIEAFDIDVETLLEGIDETEVRNQLRSIPLINGHLLAQQTRAYRRRSHWVIGSSLLCVLGISTLIAGAISKGTPKVIYDYASEEIVPNGASGESFQTLEAFIDHEFSPTRIALFNEYGSTDNGPTTEAYETLRLKYSPLATLEYRFSSDYLGNSYKENVTSGQDLINLQATGQTTGGSRTFEMYDTRSEVSSEGLSLLIAGIFMLWLGIFGFIADYRINSIRK